MRISRKWRWCGKDGFKSISRIIGFNDLLKINEEEKLESSTKEAKEGKSSPAWFHWYKRSQIYQIMHFKYVQFTVCQFYLNKIAKK